MSEEETTEEIDYSKVEVTYTAEMMQKGLPPPENWKGLDPARSVGSKGYTFDTLVMDSKKMIGFEKWEGGAARAPSINLGPNFDAYDLREFTLAHGDDNPLYIDPDYGKNTKYGCMLMYPTMLMSILNPMHHNVQDWGPFPISSLQAGYSWEYYNVIRVNSRFRASCKMKDVVEKKGRTGRLMLSLSELSYWNQRDELVATGGGIYIDVGKSGEEAKKAKGHDMSKTMLYERPIYRYSEEEIDKIVKAIIDEKRRGTTLRYWEDVKVGDKLQPIVNGPITFQDFQCGSKGGSGFLPMKSFTKNILTGWPESRGAHHYDFHMCRLRGLPGPFDDGSDRTGQSAHLICNWMGDDGFLRRISSQIRKPGYYGDTSWFVGEVVKTYKDTVGEIEYGAVDIAFSATNQVGEVSLPGKATVYLPSRELGEVKLPVPIPTKEEWKLITQRDVGDFINEIKSGETIFPNLRYFSGL